MYHLFLFYHYYPCGGMNDYQGSFSSLKEALEAAKISESDYYQVTNSDFSVCSSGKVNELK